MNRRMLLTGLALAAASAAFAEGRGAAPLAQSSAAHRYWPVVTNHRQWNVVSRQLENGTFEGRPLRRFDAPRPAARADNPTRRHVGVDLFANAGDTVVAVEDGRLVGFYPFLRASTGEMSYALMLAHDGYVANYGEVRETSLRDFALAIGGGVRAGAAIATVSDTAQLHFETYIPATTRNVSWRHGAERPSRVLDPTQLLLELAETGVRLTPP